MREEVGKREEDKVGRQEEEMGKGAVLGLLHGAWALVVLPASQVGGSWIRAFWLHTS